MLAESGLTWNLLPISLYALSINLKLSINLTVSSPLSFALAVSPDNLSPIPAVQHWKIAESGLLDAAIHLSYSFFRCLYFSSLTVSNCSCATTFCVVPDVAPFISFIIWLIYGVNSLALSSIIVVCELAVVLSCTSLIIAWFQSKYELLAIIIFLLINSFNVSTACDVSLYSKNIVLSYSWYDGVLSLGHDGIIIRSKFYDQYLVFNPNQIKSIENSGDYSLSNDSIFS